MYQIITMYKYNYFVKYTSVKLENVMIAHFIISFIWYYKNSSKTMFLDIQ